MKSNVHSHTLFSPLFLSHLLVYFISLFLSLFVISSQFSQQSEWRLLLYACEIICFCTSVFVTMCPLAIWIGRLVCASTVFLLCIIAVDFNVNIELRWEICCKRITRARANRLTYEIIPKPERKAPREEKSTLCVTRARKIETPISSSLRIHWWGHFWGQGRGTNDTQRDPIHVQECANR